MKHSILALLIATAISSDRNVGNVSAFSTVTTTVTAKATAVKRISSLAAAKTGQAEVVLVGCGAPNRGMGWYHAVQMLEGRYVEFKKKKRETCLVFVSP